MEDRGGEFTFIQGIHLRTDIRIDISISIIPITTKFGKDGHLQEETNQAGAREVITSRSNDKLNTLYLHYMSAYGHQT